MNCSAPITTRQIKPAKSVNMPGYSIADPYMCLLDFADYCRVHDEMFAVYEDRRRWNSMSVVNIAKAYRFAADSSIQNYADQIGVQEIAQAADLSPRECTRCFKRSVSRTPVRFLIEYRAQMAASLLLGTGQNISEIAENCGFMSDSYFSKAFREIYKCTPRDYRKGGKGDNI